jgi:hypothetical protein
VSNITVEALEAAGAKLKELRDKRTAAKGAFTKADKAYKEQQGIVREMMEDVGIGSFRSKKGSFALEAPEETWYATFQDFAAFERWAMENNPSLLRVDHHVSAELNKFVREQLDNGEPLPPGLGAYPKAVVKVKK